MKTGGTLKKAYLFLVLRFWIINFYNLFLFIFQALKRISSALDDDIGSVGAIRRVRKKPNLSSQYFGSGNRLNAFQHHISSPQKLLLPDEANYKASKTVEENGDDIFLNTNSVRFPSKSSEMGTKILQHLEKLTPKEKSSESKLVGAREKSPTKLTSDMLSGQALRSLEHVGPSKFMQNALDSHNSEDSPKNAHDSQMKSTVIENGPKLLAAPREMLTSSLNADTTASVKDTVLNVRSVDINNSKLEAQPPQKRRAFQMSALEVGGSVCYPPFDFQFDCSFENSQWFVSVG